MHDVYGFQPRRSGLVLAPFIDDSLVGSRIRHRFRGSSLVGVEYPAVETYRVSQDGAVPLVVRWRGKEPSSPYVVLVDGTPHEVQSGADGTVSMPRKAPGTAELRLAPP